MTSNGICQIVLYFGVILALTKPVGVFMARLFAGERTFLHLILRPLERLCYAVVGVREDAEQRWTQYAASLLSFSLFSFLFVYLLQRLQGVLPLNPAGFSTAPAAAGSTAMTPDLAFNTAASFVTNTNWQSYVGETTLSYLVQMAALIATSAAILLFTGAGSVISFANDGYWNGGFGAATANLNNGGPHGFAEILYAYTSGAANNGSAFGGIGPNTPWYNLTIGLDMLIGRFLIIIPMLAAAGSLAAKKKLAVTAGTLPTHGPLFVTLLVGTVVIVGALTFFPALSLSPIVEHFLMQQGRLF